jgi:hypothetical protein
MTDAFELLEHEHREVEELFDDFDASGEEAVAHEIGMKLAVHTEIEELVVYPVLRELDGGAELAEQAAAEHGAVSTLLARMWDSPPDDLDGLIREVRAKVTAHVEEEERTMFPLMRGGGVDAERLGRDLEEARDGARARVSDARA